ncbi:sulfatase-like hydrolase/transferase [Halorussus lipolyticus]|uniref:sulfatase-like hydrolase/transferase n=1 Tax=Halorussus lipolyticus TaxID=3034024 RepID=UPI0023E7806F|nr:sulfatase-like hydrolase/transferase [Halorussus sp. DT80]
MTSVAVVVLDTLRKDAFDDHFDWLPGARFDSAYSTANWTIPAHASLFTGQYASEAGVTAKSPSLDVESPVLAEAFRDAGYTTRCWTTNPNLGDHWDWDRGFEEFVPRRVFTHADADRIFDWESFAARHADDGPEKYLRALWEVLVSDNDTVASVRAGLGRLRGHQRLVKDVPDEGGQSILQRVRDTDFGDDEFLFVNFMEAHTPYDPPEEYRSEDEPLNVVIGDALAGTVEEPDRLRRAYDDEVRYLSDLYRETFAELREDFDYVVTLSDHGECLGEHGMWNHGYGTYPELGHVPLSIHGPGFEGSSDRLVTLLDVHRTVAELAGIDVESRGRDLRDDSDRENALVEYHGLMPGHRDQLARKGLDDERVETLDDPLNGIAVGSDYYGYETHDDGFQHVGDRPESPEETLREAVESLQKRQSDEGRGEISDELQEQLEDLGYA